MKSSIQTITAALASAQRPQPAPTPPPQQVELLTQVEMAQRLGITRRTLHTWVLDGTVPMIKIRGFCRFEPAKVWAALQRCEVNADLPNASALRRGLVPPPQANAAPSAPAPSKPRDQDDPSSSDAETRSA